MAWRFHFVIAAVVLLLTGCAATQPISQADRTALAGAHVHAVYGAAFLPTVFTPSQALVGALTGGVGGAIAGGAAVRSGQAMVTQYGLPNPGLLIRDRFIETLEARGLAHVVEQPAVGLEATDAKALAAHYPEGSVFAFDGGLAHIVYYPLRWGRYHMIYVTAARLVQSAPSGSARVLWQQTCKSERDEGDQAPTLDALYADNAARLKDWIRQSAIECAEQLLTRYTQDSH